MIRDSLKDIKMSTNQENQIGRTGSLLEDTNDEKLLIINVTGEVNMDIGAIRIRNWTSYTAHQMVTPAP